MFSYYSLEYVTIATESCLQKRCFLQTVFAAELVRVRPQTQGAGFFTSPTCNASQTQLPTPSITRLCHSAHVIYELRTSLKQGIWKFSARSNSPHVALPQLALMASNIKSMCVPEVFNYPGSPLPTAKSKPGFTTKSQKYFQSRINFVPGKFFPPLALPFTSLVTSIPLYLGFTQHSDMFLS